MAVDDLWYGRDGEPTARHGRGKRYRVRVKGHPTRSYSGKNAARAWEAHLLATPPEGPRSTLTVGECVDVWLAGKRSLASYRSYVLAADAVRERWRDTPIADVTLEDVQAWCDSMTSQDKRRGDDGQRGQHPASASTRSKRLIALWGAFAVAVRRGAIKAAPSRDDLTLTRTSRREPHYLTAAQLRALAEASSNPASIWLMGTTGVRSGEAARLTVGDVVQRRGGTRLRITRAKNGEPRDVPIPVFVLEMLNLDRPDDAPLLTAPHGGPLTMDNWRKRVFDAACGRAGLTGITPHDLRHTAVSLAIAAGADVKVVQRIAGHKSAAMTFDVYGHLLDDRLDDVAAKMGELFA